MTPTARDRELFRDRGLLHLRRLIPKALVAVAKQAIMGELTRLGARASGKWHAARFPQKMRHQPQFDAMFPAWLPAHLMDLAGVTLSPAQAQPQLLLTPPQGVDWRVPPHGWHLDVASPTRDEVSGVQVFVLVDDVLPQGGGTVAICGSHKLHSPKGGTAVSAHRALQADPAYGELFSHDAPDRERFLEPQHVSGVTVQVVEMCGNAGDVFVMDMRTVHAAAPNARRTPRMMLTNRYLRA